MVHNARPVNRRLRILVISYSLTLLAFACVSFSYLFAASQNKDFFVSHNGDQVEHFLDFLNYYASGMAVEEFPRTKNLYAEDVIPKIVYGICEPYKINSQFHYLHPYPPDIFWMMWPLVNFDLHYAWVFWVATTLVLSVLALCMYARFEKLDLSSVTYLLCASAALFPLWVAAREGQMALIILPLLAVSFLLLQRKRFFASGFFITLLSLKIQFILIPFTVGAFMGRAKYCLGALCGSLVMMFLTLVLVGWTTTVGWIYAIFQYEVNPRYHLTQVSFPMESLRGLLFTFGGGNTLIAQLISLIVFVAGVGCIAALCWRQNGQKDPHESDYILAQANLLLLVCSLHVFTADYLLSSLALLLAWCYVRFQNPTREAKLLKLIILAYPLISWLGAFRSTAIYRPQFFTMLMVSGLLFKIHFDAQKSTVQST